MGPHARFDKFCPSMRQWPSARNLSTQADDSEQHPLLSLCACVHSENWQTGRDTVSGHGSCTGVLAVPVMLCAVLHAVYAVCHALSRSVSVLCVCSAAQEKDEGGARDGQGHERTLN